MDMHPIPNHPDFPSAIILPYQRLMGQSAAGIDYYPCGTFSMDEANSELRIVGQRGSNPNHYGVNQSA
jgi:hypothetical protein